MLNCNMSGKQSTRVKAPSSWKRQIKSYAINTAYNATIPLYPGLASHSSLSGREHAHP